MDDKLVETPKVARTSNGLRSALFDQLDALRNGTGTAKEAKAVASVVSTIVATVKMEMEYHRLVGQKEPAQPGEPLKSVALAS